MISKKCCIIAMVTLISILTLTGCSTMLKNPMKYILSQDETRQDNSDKNNEAASESADDNKDDSNSEPDIRVYGTEDNTDYSINGMLAIAKDINSDMNNKDVKGVVLVLNKKYSEDVRYFLSLTVKDDKPLVIIPYDYNNGSPDYKVTQAKEYINKDFDKTDNANNQLPEGFFVNVNDYMIFDIADTKRLDNIDIVYDYVGIDADALYKNMYLNDAIVIVSSTADGELSEELSEAVSGKNASIVVVSCSEDVYMKGDFADCGDNIFYTDMSPTKARIMLVLLLDNKSDSGTFKNAFTRRRV
jgi:L-asparaginase/Glu-tRNA(Gln) amidotransferase subunit D